MTLVLTSAYPPSFFYLSGVALFILRRVIYNGASIQWDRMPIPPWKEGMQPLAKNLPFLTGMSPP